MRGLPGVLWRSLGRLWGRDMMLFVGGVSFFVMLATFPGLMLLVGVYGLVSSPEAAAGQAESLTSLAPAGARELITVELRRLAHAPAGAVSAQSGFALLVALYAAHRGFKALIAGLSFVHDEEAPHGLVRFNLLALGLLASAFLLLPALSLAFLALQVVTATLGVQVLSAAVQWVVAAGGVILALALIYRYAMSSRPLLWRAAFAGAASAAALTLAASWAAAVYVNASKGLGAAYGSVTAVVILLIWLSWSVQAIFFGGALATEAERYLEGETPGP